MSDNLNALLGLDRYAELLREADNARLAKKAQGLFGIRLWLARALVRLAIELVPGGSLRRRNGLIFGDKAPWQAGKVARNA